MPGNVTIVLIKILDKEGISFRIDLDSFDTANDFMCNWTGKN